MGLYDLSRVSFYRITHEELRVARRLRELRVRALRRARLLLALRYYGAAGTAAALIVAAAATIILLAGQLTPTPNFWIVMGASAAGTVLVLGLASSHELNRRLGEWKRELEAVTDELEMHRDTILVLNRHLREVRR